MHHLRIFHYIVEARVNLVLLYDRYYRENKYQVFCFVLVEQYICVENLLFLIFWELKAAWFSRTAAVDKNLANELFVIVIYIVLVMNFADSVHTWVDGVFQVKWWTFCWNTFWGKVQFILRIIIFVVRSHFHSSDTFYVEKVDKDLANH